jgi:hypothetical protein
MDEPRLLPIPERCVWGQLERSSYSPFEDYWVAFCLSILYLEYTDSLVG